MKLLRFRNIKEVTPSGFDGRRYRVQFEVGSRPAEHFEVESTHEFDVEVSGTLQTVWRQNDAALEVSSASAATAYVMALAADDRLRDIPPLVLNTYSAPRSAPTEPAVSPGATYPIHRPTEEPRLDSDLSFLSEDVSKIRDEINALTSDLWGQRLLHLSQERALFDMYKKAVSEEEFRNRVQSLAGISTDLNNSMLEDVAERKRDENTGNLILLAIALGKISGPQEAEQVVDVLKNINSLRQGYPAHSDAAKKHLDAHAFFGLRYPISDFPSAWETVLARYFDAMKMMREHLSDAWENRHGHA